MIKKIRLWKIFSVGRYGEYFSNSILVFSICLDIFGINDFREFVLEM